MREKQKLVKKCSRMFRITPAYAGKTSFSENVGNFVEDHPRVCGKNAVFK